MPRKERKCIFKVSNNRENIKIHGQAFYNMYYLVDLLFLLFEKEGLQYREQIYINWLSENIFQNHCFCSFYNNRGTQMKWSFGHTYSGDFFFKKCKDFAVRVLPSLMCHSFVWFARYIMLQVCLSLLNPRF